LLPAYLVWPTALRLRSGQAEGRKRMALLCEAALRCAARAERSFPARARIATSYVGPGEQRGFRGPKARSAGGAAGSRLIETAGRVGAKTAGNKDRPARGGCGDLGELTGAGKFFAFPAGCGERGCGGSAPRRGQSLNARGATNVFITVKREADGDEGNLPHRMEVSYVPGYAISASP